jgi:hypothetical protein
MEEETVENDLVKNKTKLEIEKLELDIANSKKDLSPWLKKLIAVMPPIVSFIAAVATLCTLVSLSRSGILNAQASINKSESLLNKISSDSLHSEIVRQQASFDSMHGTISQLTLLKDSMHLKISILTLTQDSLVESGRRDSLKAVALFKSLRNKDESEKVVFLSDLNKKYTDSLSQLKVALETARLISQQISQGVNKRMSFLQQQNSFLEYVKKDLENAKIEIERLKNENADLKKAVP